MDSFGDGTARPATGPATDSVGEDDDAVRNLPRDSLFLQATLIPALDAAATTVRVRNLSAGGCLIESSLVVAMGDTITIRFRHGGDIGARVAWTGPGRFGLAFQRTIDPAAMRQPVGVTPPPPHAALRGLNRPIRPTPKFPA